MTHHAPDLAAYRQRVFHVSDPDKFNALAMEMFYFQARNNPVYKAFLQHLNVVATDITTIDDIPYLPVGFFKTQQVVSRQSIPAVTFTSSGTTGSSPSRHVVADLKWYEESFHRGFQRVYGDVGQYCILALLPNYLERKGSSLVYMAEKLIRHSGHPDSGFYLDNTDVLANKLKELEANGQKTILLGVTFALLDLAEQYPMPLKHTIIMETGGMKGRRKELVREELHGLLKNAFDVPAIHSEYGMTELLSQAYATENGRFTCPAWMKVTARDPNDPFSSLDSSRTGGLNIIDLANFWSCAFIATQDLGRVYADGSFEVLGRFDHSDLRGCSLLVA